MVITLVGFRGAGKSSVGPELASRLGWESVDADAVIVQRAGQPIAEIFARQGEASFRGLEAEVLAELLQSGERVLAAGGGAVLRPDTRLRMREAGPVVWLQASLETVWSRIQSTLGASRPALTPLNPRQEIEALLEERTPLYAEASTIAVSTDGRSVAEIVAEIESQLPLAARRPRR
jgi:shikimate kinase